MKRGKSA